MIFPYPAAAMLLMQKHQFKYRKSKERKGQGMKMAKEKSFAEWGGLQRMMSFL